MPTINVQMFEGRSAEQKREFQAVTEVACRTLGCEPASVDIIIQDVSRNNWASGGKLWSEPPEPV